VTLGSDPRPSGKKGLGSGIDLFPLCTAMFVLLKLFDYIGRLSCMFAALALVVEWE
jgi:spore maturation protein SpmB